MEEGRKGSRCENGLDPYYFSSGSADEKEGDIRVNHLYKWALRLVEKCGFGQHLVNLTGN